MTNTATHSANCKCNDYRKARGFKCLDVEREERATVAARKPKVTLEQITEGPWRPFSFRYFKG